MSWAQHCSQVDPGVNYISFIQESNYIKKFATVFMKQAVWLWEQTGVLVIKRLHERVLVVNKSPSCEVYALVGWEEMINNKKANYKGYLKATSAVGTGSKAEQGGLRT